MKRLLLFFIFLLSVCAYAQNPPHLKFEQPMLHLGNFKSKAGIIHLNFKFKNVDKKPVMILDVHAQCGCTQAKFPLQPIAVGDSGEVKVDFDPHNLFGDQSRSLVVVSTNGDYKKFNTLTIDGHITDGPTREELFYPVVLCPSLRSNMASVGTGRLISNETNTISILQLYNNSKRDILLQAKTSNEHITINIPPRLSPSEMAIMKVTIKTRGMPLGLIHEKVYLYVDGVMIAEPIKVEGLVEK